MTRNVFLALLVALLPMLLACGFFDRLLTTANPNAAAPTDQVTEGEAVLLTLYRETRRLPSYELFGTFQTEQGATETLEQRVDGRRNMHLVITSASQPLELIRLDGVTYLYDRSYKGWVAQERNATFETTRWSVENPLDILSDKGVIPIAPSAEIFNERPTLRYQLQHRSELATQPSATNWDGSLWVDETGALVNLEAFRYDDGVEPSETITFAVTDVNRVNAIQPPAPIIDPTASASATATAEIFLALETRMAYQTEVVSFDIVPRRVIQVPNSSPLSAAVELSLRRLPEAVIQSGDAQPFLAMLRNNLTLSIPARNLVVTSSGFKIEGSNVQDGVVDVVYYFNADLENFDHIELVIAGQGNPQFVPVPIE